MRTYEGHSVIKVSVIQADIPLLLGNDIMKERGISLINDPVKKQSYIRIGRNKKIDKTTSGHWKVEIKGPQEHTHELD